MANIVFTTPGIQVHKPNPSEDVDFHTRGDLDNLSHFDGRVPFLWNSKARELHVGEPGWYHGDVANHHGIDTWYAEQGFFGGGAQWGEGKLKYYAEEPDQHPEIAQALIEAGYKIPNPDASTHVSLPPQDHDEPWEDDSLDEWH